MDKTYVTFYFPGSFISESIDRPVADRSDPKDIPVGCYGYRFFSQSETFLDGELLTGRPKDFSGTTFFGEVMTASDVERLPGDHHILLSNMRCNKWEKVVRTIQGNFQPLCEGDRVIAS